MTFVGSLIKNTTRASYEYRLKNKVNHPQQAKVLRLLLSKGKKTSFGKIYSFTSLLSLPEESLLKEFSDKVPIYSYERFYKEFLKYQICGSKHVVWGGETHYYALTSGTTEGSSKRVPVSDSMIKQFHKTSLEQIAALHELNLPPTFFKSSVLTVGGSTRLTSVNQHWEGDLSGILEKNKSLLYRLFTKPGKAINTLKNWDDKLTKIVKAAPTWDIGVVAGSPVWVNKVIESIVKEYKLSSIHEIWPNFKLFLHGGVFLSTYRASIDKLCKNKLIYLDTYLTSEGYFAYQRTPDENGMLLLTNHGVYYEFVEEKYFDLLMSNDQLHNIPTLTLSQVEQNNKYAIVVSTCSGLWRYCLGDVVEFTSCQPHRVKIIGRVKHTLNIVGEHLSVDNMNQALLKTNAGFDITTEEFCVVSKENKHYHHWYIGSNQAVIDTDKYASLLNVNLEEVNDDYRDQRRYNLGAPKVTFLPLQKFYEFMESTGKSGGQNKFPRVLSSDQASEWEAFLSRLV